MLRTIRSPISSPVSRRMSASAPGAAGGSAEGALTTVSGAFMKPRRARYATLRGRRDVNRPAPARGSVPEPDVAVEREIPTHRPALEVLGHVDPGEVRVPVEGDAEHVVRLALGPVRAVPER